MNPTRSIYFGVILLLIASPAFASNLGLVADAMDIVLYVVDPDAQQVVATVSIPDEGDIRACAVTRDGTLGFATYFSSTFSTNRLLYIDLAADPPAPIAALNIPNSGLDIDITPGGEFVVVCGVGTSPIAVVDVSIFTVVAQVPVITQTSNSISICDDGQSILVTVQADSTVRRLTIDGLGVLTDTGESRTVAGQPRNCYCAPGSQSAVVGSANTFPLPSNIESVAIPGLAIIDQEQVSNAEFRAGVFDDDGSNFYFGYDQFSLGHVSVYGYALGVFTPSGIDRIVDAFGPPATPSGGAEYLALNSTNGELFVSESDSLSVFTPLTLNPAGSIIDTLFLAGPASLALPSAPLSTVTWQHDGAAIAGEWEDALLTISNVNFTDTVFISTTTTGVESWQLGGALGSLGFTGSEWFYVFAPMDSGAAPLQVSVTRAETITLLATGPFDPAVSDSLVVDHAAAQQLFKVSGDGQAVPIGNSLPLPLVVRVEDTFGNVVDNEPVSFSAIEGGGQIDVTAGGAPDSVAISDSQGLAVCEEWVMGLTIGTNRARAQLSAGVDSVEFVATALFGLIDPPTIIEVKDIPNDQGRQARLRWWRSAQDSSGTAHTITGYSVFRRIDIAAYMNALEGGPVETAADPMARSLPPGLWDYLDTVPARGDVSYSMVLPTLCDSTITSGQCYSVFFVSANTSDPLVFFDSAPDSGYSLDNLAPGAPESLVVATIGQSANQLSWLPHQEPDFQYFKVYRGLHPGFSADPSTLVHTTPDSDWIDNVEEPWRYFYKLSAVDFAGNEGPVTSQEIATGIDGDLPPETSALHQNVPNPFNPVTTIAFALESQTHVTISVYDVAGRSVVDLIDRPMGIGVHQVEWDGRDATGTEAASGIYFYRMTAGDFVRVKKMVLLR